jgi:hypothetical protein
MQISAVVVEDAARNTRAVVLTIVTQPDGVQIAVPLNPADAHKVAKMLSDQATLAESRLVLPGEPGCVMPDGQKLPS